MSKDYSADQGGIYSKGADGASNADSGVDENGSGVFDSASSSPYFCSEHFEESPQDSTDEISNPSAFTPFVRKSLGGKVDASDSQAGQKRKKSESPENGGGASSEEDFFMAVRSRSSNAGGLGGVGRISSNGAKGASSSNGAKDASSSNVAKGASSSSDGGVQNPDGGFSAGRIRSSSVGGRSSNVESLDYFWRFLNYNSMQDSLTTFDGLGGAVASNGIGEGGVLRGNEGKFRVEKSTQTSPREVNSSAKDDQDLNPSNGFSAFRIRSSNAGGLGGVGGSYSNGGVGGVDYLKSGASASEEFNLDYEFLNGVENLKKLQSDSRGTNQSPALLKQEAPSSLTASSSSSMLPSLTPSESSASRSGSSELVEDNSKPR